MGVYYANKLVVEKCPDVNRVNQRDFLMLL